MYTECPRCDVRLKKLADSKKLFGSPPEPAHRYYRCGSCGRYWTLDRERNAINAGVPGEYTKLV
jgi:uncharacterized protein with PIN domain